MGGSHGKGLVRFSTKVRIRVERDANWHSGRMPVAKFLDLLRNLQNGRVAGSPGFIRIRHPGTGRVRQKIYRALRADGLTGSI